LIGEWGIPLKGGDDQSNFAQTESSKLVSTFKAFRKHHPTVTFYWAHNFEIDTSTTPHHIGVFVGLAEILVEDTSHAPSARSMRALAVMGSPGGWADSTTHSKGL
jgi:hypothetical protein